MSRKYITPKALLSLSLMATMGAVAFVGCDEAASIAAESGDQFAMLQEGEGEDARRPPPPKPCADTADCDGACPPGSAGCTCADTPMGQRCVPSCSADDDCPAVPGPPLSCHEGVCVPPLPPPPPSAS